MDVSFHPAAREELRQARAWYEERSPLSALAFATEITRAVKQIAEAPTRYPLAEYGSPHAGKGPSKWLRVIYDSR